MDTCPTHKYTELDTAGECPTCKALGSSDGSPLRVRYALAEMEMLLKAWMVNEFGHPRDYITDPDQKDKWYRDYGLLYHFIRDHFPAENSDYPEQLSR